MHTLQGRFSWWGSFKGTSQQHLSACVYVPRRQLSGNQLHHDARVAFWWAWNMSAAICWRNLACTLPDAPSRLSGLAGSIPLLCSLLWASVALCTGIAAAFASEAGWLQSVMSIEARVTQTVMGLPLSMWQWGPGMSWEQRFWLGMLNSFCF